MLSKGGDDSVKLDFGLSSANLSEAARKAWPMEFGLVYSVTLGKEGLQTMLNVRNQDTKAWEFQMLLHSYFAVDEISKTKVTGLGRYAPQHTTTAQPLYLALLTDTPHTAPRTSTNSSTPNKPNKAPPTSRSPAKSTASTPPSSKTPHRSSKTASPRWTSCETTSRTPSSGTRGLRSRKRWVTLSRRRGIRRW